MAAAGARFNASRSSRLSVRITIFANDGSGSSGPIAR